MHPWTPYWFADELPSLAHAFGWLLVAGRRRGLARWGPAALAAVVVAASTASARSVWAGDAPGWALPAGVTWAVLVASLWGAPSAGPSSPWRLLPLGLGLAGPWAFAAGVALAGLGATATRWARSAIGLFVLQAALHGPLAQRAWALVVAAGASFDEASVGLRVGEGALIVMAWICVGFARGAR